MMDNILDINVTTEQSSYIKIIGVGGAGTNAVNHMYNNKITGVDFIVCNTDRQSLEKSPVQNKIQLGKGLGAGNTPPVGKKAAEAAEEQIRQALSGNTHMLFIAAGMGGGTGTGASPVIARIAKEIEVVGDANDEEKDEILVVGIVTIPFAFEGRRRREQAIAGIEELKKYVDAMIVVNTDKLKERGKMNMRASFALADDILLTAAKGVSEMMTANESYIHVDFKDVQSVMRNSGVALMGSGVGEGEDRAYKAVEAAATCDLLNNNDLSQTKNVLMYISCSSDAELEIDNEEIETITGYIQEITNRDVDIIWGYGYDDSLEGKVSVTLVATGFEFKEIYNPTQREDKVKIHDPLQTKSNILSTPLNNSSYKSTPSTLEEKKEEEAKKLEEFTLIRQTPETDFSLSSQQETKPEGKVFVLEMDEVEQIEDIRQEEEKPSFINNTSNLTREEAFKELDIIHRKEPQIEVVPEVTRTEPIVETIIEEENNVVDSEPEYESMERPVSLGSIISGATEREETKWERIKQMREMLKTRSGIEQLENFHSIKDDANEFLSAEKQATHNLTMGKSGNLTYAENQVINSTVD